MRGNRFVVRSVHGRRFQVNADSEPAAQLPAEFSILNRAVTVLVPRDKVGTIR